MMDEKFTIAFPCRNRIALANEAIRLMLDSCPYDITVVDDASDQPDAAYIEDARIRLVTNKEKKGMSALFNQCIRESRTENVILTCDKITVQPSDFDLISKKLEEGFACVATRLLHIFAFSKYLTTKIGFFDEGYRLSGYEDTDWMNKLFMNDLALYFSEETAFNQVGSGWHPNTLNGSYYKHKWIETLDAVIQIKQDENYGDRLLYKDEYPDREYLPWSESELKTSNVFNYYKGKTPLVRIGLLGSKWIIPSP